VATRRSNPAGLRNKGLANNPFASWPEPLRQAAGRGVLSGEIWTGDWEDVGTPERYAALNRRLDRRPESPPA